MATLIINTWSSKCGACNRGADPSERRHETVMGYGDFSSETGCLELFTSLTTDYMGADIEAATRRIRPDLPFKGVAWRDEGETYRH